MTRLRARVAERLKGAQNTYAMLTTFNEIDMTNLMQLRKDFKVCYAMSTCCCTILQHCISHCQHHCMTSYPGLCCDNSHHCTHAGMA